MRWTRPTAVLFGVALVVSACGASTPPAKIVIPPPPATSLSVPAKLSAPALVAGGSVIPNAASAASGDSGLVVHAQLLGALDNGLQVAVQASSPVSLWMYWGPAGGPLLNRYAPPGVFTKGAVTLPLSVTGPVQVAVYARDASGGEASTSPMTGQILVRTASVQLRGATVAIPQGKATVSVVLPQATVQLLASMPGPMQTVRTALVPGFTLAPGATSLTATVRASGTGGTATSPVVVALPASGAVQQPVNLSIAGLHITMTIAVQVSAQ